MRVLLKMLPVLVLLTFPFSGMAQENPSNPVYAIDTTAGKIIVELFIREAPVTVKNFIDLAEGRKAFTEPATEKEVKRPFYDNLIFHRVIKDFMIQGGCPKGDGTGGPGYRFEDEINAIELGLDKISVMRDGGGVHPHLLVRTNEDFQRIVFMPLLKKMGIASQQELDKQKPEVQSRLDRMSLKDCYENTGYRYNDYLKSQAPTRGKMAMANSGPNTNGSQFFINLVDTPWLTGKHTVFGEVIEGMDVVDKIGETEVDTKGRPKPEIRIRSIRPAALPRSK